jgi:hypothetical protein
VSPEQISDEQLKVVGRKRLIAAHALSVARPGPMMTRCGTGAPSGRAWRCGARGLRRC